MAMPYENATSGGAALEDIRKLLTKFGCARFGTMTDQERGELIVQFTYRGRDITAKASYKGYAAAWLKEHPYGPRTRGRPHAHAAACGNERRPRVDHDALYCCRLRGHKGHKASSTSAGRNSPSTRRADLA